MHVNEYGDFEYIAVCDYNTCWRHGVEPESNWMASLVLPDTDADTIPAVSKGKRVAATANARCPAPVVMHTPPTKDDPSHHSRKSEALPKPVVALAVSGGWPNQTAEIIVACTDSDIYIPGTLALGWRVSNGRVRGDIKARLLFFIHSS